MKFCLDPCVESLESPIAHVKASGATALSRCDLLLTCLFTYYRLVITHLRGGGYTYGAHFGGASWGHPGIRGAAVSSSRLVEVSLSVQLFGGDWSAFTRRAREVRRAAIQGWDAGAGLRSG